MAGTNYQTILVTKENGLTMIAFNRSDMRNAMSPQLHWEMYSLVSVFPILRKFSKHTQVATESILSAYDSYGTLPGAIRQCTV